MYTKESKLKMKADIKKLVAEQKENRRNRKTVHLVGERTMEPYEAMWKHQSLRFTLYLHYIAYAIMRGKSDEWINKHVDQNYIATNKDVFSKSIEKILKSYEEAVCTGA